MNNTINTLKSPLALALATLLGLGGYSGVATADAPTSKHLNIPAAVNDHILLGTAYNRYTKRFLGLQVLQGTDRSFSTINETVAQTKERITVAEAASLLAGSLEASGEFGPLSLGVSGSMSSEMASDSQSMGFTYYYNHPVMGVALDPLPGDGGVLQLSSLAGQVKTKIDNGEMTDQQMLDAVGTDYVSEVYYGGRLLVNSKVHFGSAATKALLSGEITIESDLITVEGSLTSEQEAAKQNVKVTVRATQQGGEPAQLFTILPADLVTCTLDDLGPCNEVITNAKAYAVGNFVEQFTDPANYNVLYYKTTQYGNTFLDVDDFALDDAAKAQISPNVTHANLELIETGYERELQAKNRAKSMLKNHGSLLTPGQRELLTRIGEHADNNVHQLSELYEYCSRNVIGNDCQTFVNAHCALENPGVPLDPRFACNQDYSTEIFDLNPTTALQAKREEFYRGVRVQGSGYGDRDARMRGIVKELYPQATQISLVSSGQAPEFNQSNRRFKLFGQYYFIVDGTYNHGFMVEASRRLNVEAYGTTSGTMNTFAWKADSSKLGGGSWVSNMGQASKVGDYYRYLVRHNDALNPVLLIEGHGDISSGAWVRFRSNPVVSVSSVQPMKTYEPPVQWTAVNVSESKDIDGNDIGWCATNGGLNRSNGYNYCRQYGRLYTWADAEKACAAYDKNYGEYTGRRWRLPSYSDWKALEAIAETKLPGQAGNALKITGNQFDSENQEFDGTGQDLLRFRAQSGGWIHDDWTQSNATLNDVGGEGYYWTSTPSSSIGGNYWRIWFDKTEDTVGFATRNNRKLYNVRCVGEIDD